MFSKFQREKQVTPLKKENVRLAEEIPKLEEEIVKAQAELHTIKTQVPNSHFLLNLLLSFFFGFSVLILNGANNLKTGRCN